MNKPIYKKWWFWVIVVLVIGAIGGAGGSSENEVPSTADTSVVEQTPTKTPEQSKPVVEEKESSKEVPTKVTYGVGDTATAKSYTLTVEALNVIESDNQFNQPAEGYEFVEVVLLMENISNSDLHVSMLDYDAYVDGFSTNHDISAQVASKYESFGGTVAPGKKLRGVVCYQLPVDWAELEIQIDMGFSSKDEITLLLTK